MIPVSWKRLAWLVVFGSLGGCHYPVQPNVDRMVCQMAAQPLDITPVPSQPPDEATPGRERTPPGQASPSPAPSSSSAAAGDPNVRPAAFGQAQAPGKATIPPQPQTPSSTQQPPTGRTATPPSGPQPRPGTTGPQQPPEKFERLLEMPQELPGARLPPLVMPRPGLPPAEREKAFQRLYPPLPPVEPTPTPGPGPFGHPLTLAELEQLAMANSPLIRQAAADVEAAKGAAKQAGAYPNPNFGYESDDAGTSATAGYQGIFLEQIIKTAGKLKVAQASALMNLLNAQLAFRRAQTDLEAAVRSGYFAVLVAREGVRWNQGLQKFTEQIYDVYIRNARAGILAGYEPLALRAVAVQTRGTLAQTQSHYLATWKQLAATLGLPELPLTELAGHAEMPVPVFDPEAVLARVLAVHTDVLTARNTLQRARYDLRTAEITPIPDVDFRLAVQKDFTMPPFGIVHSIQMGIPIPIWDQNRGNIRQAQGALLRATEEEHRVRAALASTVADAFDRYESNRLLAEYYRRQVLPDLSQVYSRTLLRFARQLPPGAAPDQVGVGAATVALADVITSQQAYITALATYATTLGSLWQAVTDVASALQLDDLFGVPQVPPGAAAQELEHLPLLPCGHPCNPLLAPAASGPAPCAPAAPGSAPTAVLPDGVQTSASGVASAPRGSGR